MLDDTDFAKCKCSESDCSRNASECDCSQYCFLFTGTVAGFTNRRCVTISPNPHSFETIPKVHDEWLERFYKMRRHISGAVIVLELAGLRPHYHCIFDVVDRVGFTATLFSWSTYHNVKRHNMFKGGIHYLFKEVNKTRADTEIDPIFTYADMLQLQKEKQITRALRTLELKAIHNNKSFADIPNWMKAGDSDIGSDSPSLS